MLKRIVFISFVTLETIVGCGGGGDDEGSPEENSIAANSGALDSSFGSGGVVTNAPASANKASCSAMDDTSLYVAGSGPLRIEKRRK